MSGQFRRRNKQRQSKRSRRWFFWLAGIGAVVAYFSWDYYSQIRAEHLAALRLGALSASMEEDWDAALMYHKATIEAEGPSSVVYNEMGIVASRAGHVEDALSFLREAKALNPAAFRAQLNIANVLREAGGRATEAIAEYEALFKMREDCEPHRSYGKSEIGTVPAWCEEMKAERDAVADALYSGYVACATLLVHEDAMTKAELYLKAALKIKETPDVLLKLASIYKEQGADSVAMSYLVRCTENFNQGFQAATCHTHIGELLEAMGKTEDARVAYQAAVDIEADYGFAKNRLDALRGWEPMEDLDKL